MHSLIPSRRRSNRPASTSTSPRLPLEPGVTFPPQTLTTPGSAPATSAEHATPPSTYPRFANDPNMLVTAERISSSGAQAVMRANRLRLCNSLGGLIPDNISERLLDPSVDAYDSVRQLVGYACSHSTRLMTGIDSYIASWDSGGVVGESLGRGTGPGSGTWGIAGEIVQNYDPAADNHRPRRASLSTPSGTGTTPRMSALPAPRLRRPSQAASPARFGGPSMPTPAAVPPSRGPGFPAGYLPSAQGAVASSPPAQRLRAVSMSGQGSGSGAYPGSSALPGARSMALRVPSDLYAFPGPGGSNYPAQTGSTTSSLSTDSPQGRPRVPTNVALKFPDARVFAHMVQELNGVAIPSHSSRGPRNPAFENAKRTYAALGAEIHSNLSKSINYFAAFHRNGLALLREFRKLKAAIENGNLARSTLNSYVTVASRIATTAVDQLSRLTDSIDRVVTNLRTAVRSETSLVRSGTIAAVVEAVFGRSRQAKDIRRGTQKLENVSTDLLSVMTSFQGRLVEIAHQLSLIQSRLNHIPAEDEVQRITDWANDGHQKSATLADSVSAVVITMRAEQAGLNRLGEARAGATNPRIFVDTVRIDDFDTIAEWASSGESNYLEASSSGQGSSGSFTHQ